MTQVDTPPAAQARIDERGSAPSRFGLVLLVAVIVPTVALFFVPQPLLDPIGLCVVALVLLTGAIAVGAAVASVLRSASQQAGTLPARGANTYFTAAAFSFFALCFIAPGAAFIASGAWFDINTTDHGGVLLTFVAGGAISVGAVFAVAGLILAGRREVRMRLAWAEVDLAVQVLALGAVLATVAILY